MNQQDKSFMMTFTVVLSVLVLIAIAIFLAAQMISVVTVVPDDGVRTKMAAEERLRPVAQVAITDPSAAKEVATAPAEAAGEQVAAVDSTESEQAAAVDTVEVAPAATENLVPADTDLAQGEETYNAVCSVCHAQGVAGAPITGDKDAWAPRLAKGWDTLVEHSIKGFNAMPAKGGRADLPDEQIAAAVGYLISQGQ